MFKSFDQFDIEAIVIVTFSDEKYVCKFLKSVKHYRAGQGVLNKDPIVRLDGARPVNTFIPPSFPESPYSCTSTHKQKYVCEYMKMDVCKHKINR